jgi:hypothetical protein
MPVAYFMLGLALLASLLLLARWFVRADPKTLVTTVKWVGVVVAALIAIFLAIRGQAPFAFALAVGALMMWRRMRGLASLGAMFGGAFGPRGGGAKAGQSSDVETAYLRMSLDHDSGEMDGTVLQGAFEGRTLSNLKLDELLDLLGECARADEQSARLVEAYLDRAGHDDWRERMDARHGARGAAGMTDMSPDQAREILGVGPAATREEIKEAHRRLMQMNHPDRGGSTFLAAQINLAKEVLLGA